jgi:hypothetical protein
MEEDSGLISRNIQTLQCIATGELIIQSEAIQQIVGVVA